VQPFDLLSLLFPGLCIFVFTIVVGSYVTQNVAVSLFAAMIKSGSFLIYFAVLFDGTFTSDDDWAYFAGGEAFLNEGVGLLNLAENWDFALATGGGDHFIYHLYNSYAFKLFGVGYYAPVALNIILTILIAWVGSIVGAKEFDFTGPWRSIFFIFLLFHPDIYIWSNVMNVKDILVLFMHVLLILSFSLYFEGRSRFALIIAVPAIFILLNLRFYVPVIFASAILTQQLLNTANRRGRPFVVGVLAIILSAIISVIQHLIPQSISVLQENLRNPIVGFLHMVFTPIPFNTDARYAFLNIPALLHWLMVPLAAYGLRVIVRGKQSNFSTIFLIYSFVFMAVYSINSELTGPRHRVQLDFAWAVLQFIGFRTLLGWLLFVRR
jgi:hypothetical protein